MSNNGNQEVKRINAAFNAIVFVILGTSLLEACCLATRSRIAAHAFILLLAAPVIALCVHRWRASIVVWERGYRPAKNNWYIISGTCLLLLAAGNVLARVALTGWVTPTAALVFGLCLVPWSRIPLCRQHFLTSIALVVTGAAYPVLHAAASTHPVSLLAGAWVLWGGACFVLLGTIRPAKKARRNAGFHKI